jgi:hypothetical protein
MCKQGHVRGSDSQQERLHSQPSDLLAEDPDIISLLPPDEVRELLDAGGYVGEAPVRARSIARLARESLSPP